MEGELGSAVSTGPVLALLAFFCIRQWILNQFDRLPYRHPDLDMPTFRHLRSRQALHEVRLRLSITQR